MAKLSSQFASISPGMSTEEAQTGLVSVMKAFDVDVEDVERKIMDNINVLGNKFAEDNLDIITGMEKAGATFAAVGTSIEDSFALFTGAQEIIQNAETVGTALKTLSLRIRGYDEETEELSEDVIAATGKVADLTKVASNNYAGVSLWADAEQTEYRSMREYLGDIADIYDEISAKNRTELLENLFGKRGASVGSSILLNFDQVEKALDEMEQAGGAADAEMDIIMDSIDYKVNALKETWVGVLQELIDRGTLGDFIDRLTDISEIVGDIITQIGPLPSAIGAIGLSKVIINLDNIKKIIPEIGANILNAKTEGTLLSTVLSGLGKGAIIAGLAILAKTIYECATANSKLAEKTSELYNKFEDSKSEIDSYKSEISELQTTLADNNVSYEDAKTARERLLTIQEELISKYGAEAGGILAVTEALNGQVDALDKLSQAQWNKTLAQVNDDGTWFKWIGSKWNQINHNASSNEEVILREMESTARFIDIQQNETNKEFINALKNIGADIFEVQNAGGGTDIRLMLNQNVEDATTELNKYLDLANKTGVSDNITTGLLNQLNTLSELTDQYGEFYNQYVLYEKIFKNDSAAEYFNQLSQIGNKYKEALVNDDSTTAEILSKNYAEIFGKAISSIDDKSVINYFRDMYPELQAEINKWNLKADLGIDLDTDSESAITEEGKQLVEAIEQFRNIEELMSHDETDEYFARLATAADKYGYSIEELIKLLSQYYNLNFDFRDDAKLIDNVISRDSNYGRKDVDTQRHERTNIDNAFELLSDDDYQIAESFGDEQWDEVITKVKEVQREQGVAYLSAQEYADVISEVADKWTEVEEIVEETEKTAFSEQLSNLNTIEDNLEQIQSIADDIADGEDFDFSALSSDDFAEAFSSLDSYEQFIETISSNTSSLTECQDALNKLATEYIAAQSAAGLFNEETKKTAIAMLNQAGIANAEAVVESQIALAKRDTILADIEATTAGQKLTAVMHDEELAALDSVQALKQRAQAGEEVSQQDAQNVLSEQAFQNASIQTKAQIISLIAQLQVFNNTGLDVSQKLQALQQLATQAGLTGTAVAYATQLDKYNLMKANMSEDAIKHLEDTGYFKDDMSSYMSEVVSEMTKYQEEAAKVVPSSNAVADSSGSAADAAEEEADAMSDLSSELDELQDAYSKLLSIQEEYNTNGKISVDSAQELMQMDFRYLAMLQTEGGALKLNEQAFQSVAQAKLNEMKITMIRNALNTMQSITTEAQAEAYLAMCTGEANMATAEATALQAALQAQMQGTTGAIAEAYNVIYSGLQNAMALLGENFANVDFSTLSSSATDATSDVAETVEEEFEKVFDWFERRLTVLQKKADLYAAKRANADMTYYSKYSGYNYYLNRERAVYKQQKQTTAEQIKAYEEEYRKAIEGLDAETVAAIEGNRTGIQTITDQAMSDAIDKAIEWKDKLDDAKISIEEIQTKINDISLEKLSYYASLKDLNVEKKQHKVNLIESGIDLVSALGYTPTSSAYKKTASLYSKELKARTDELGNYQKKMQAMVKNGNLTKNSEQYLEAEKKVREIEEEIAELKVKQAEAEQEARDAAYEQYKFRQQIADYRETELQSIYDLYDEDDAVDDNARFTSAGYSMMGAQLFQWKSNTAQVEEYKQQLAVLDQQYANDKNSTEYIERSEEIRQAMYESAAAAKENKEAIVELAKARIEQEISIIEDQIDAYEELIDKQKENLQSQKDLHDYQKSIAESTKDIATLERQLAAIENDNSASAIAKRRKLEEELSEARESLEEKQYEHSIDSAEAALDAQLAAYKANKEAEITELEEKMEDENALFEESKNLVLTHTTEISTSLQQLAIDTGVSITNNVVSAWQQATNAVDTYWAHVKQSESDYVAAQEAETAAALLESKKNEFTTAQAKILGNIDSYISKTNVSKTTKDNWTSSKSFSTKKISQAIAAGQYDSASNKIDTLLTKIQSSKKLTDKQKKKLKTYLNKIKTNIANRGFAGGVHKLSLDQLAWTQEYGDEAILSPSRDAILTPLRAGDSVLTAKQTESLFNFAKNPLDFLKNLNINANVPEFAAAQGVTLNIDNVLTVQGDVNNSNAKQIAEIAQSAITKAFYDFSSKIKKA